MGRQENMMRVVVMLLTYLKGETPEGVVEEGGEDVVDEVSGGWKGRCRC